ncbi:MAG: DUF63 family protein [Candidatus Hydrothermarchaeales archaeon]
MAVYTPLDYAIGLAILFFIMWLASRYLFTAIEFDRYLVFAMAPVIVFGVAVRVLADAGVFVKSELWSVTPGIYITATAFGIFIIGAGKAVEKTRNIPYWKTAFVAGSFGAIYFSYLLFLQMKNPYLPLRPFLLAFILTYFIYILSNFSKRTRIFRARENAAIIFAHMLDGSATFIGIDYFGFSEEHILPEYLINAAGTASVMIPLKIVVILGALYLLDRWKEEEEGSDLYYKMIKFVFFIFGFGPGLRDALLLGL